jgi:cytochrome c oxidase assembly protein subunit 15
VAEDAPCIGGGELPMDAATVLARAGIPGAGPAARFLEGSFRSAGPLRDPTRELRSPRARGLNEPMSPLRRFALWVLGYNVAVVLWGAVVRATGSGAGCGAHWPLCNGTVVPRSATAETLIELTHRLMSGLSLVLVAALLAWALRARPRGHAARKAAVASAVLVVTEALVGAGLVLFGWVARDASAARGWVVAVHLLNTFLLLGTVTLTAELADRSGGLAIRGRAPLAVALGLGIATMLLAGATGAVAALGDTLHPARSVMEGISQDLAGDTPFLLRLRMVHPFASLAAALVLVLVGRTVMQSRDPMFRLSGLRLLALLGLQLLAGALNLALLAPVWMQIVHLALADLTWIALVVLAAQALSPAPQAAEHARRATAPA